MFLNKNMENLLEEKIMSIATTRKQVIGGRGDFLATHPGRGIHTPSSGRDTHRQKDNNRYIVEVEFDNPEFDYGVLFDATLKDLVSEYCDAKIKGFHITLGSCVNISVIRAMNIHGYILTKTFNRLVNNELERRRI